LEFLLGNFGRARQRIVLMCVERANSLAVEALFLDFQIGPEQKRSWKLLDRKANCLGGSFEPAVSHRVFALARATRKQFGRSSEIKRLGGCVHDARTMPRRRARLTQTLNGRGF